MPVKIHNKEYRTVAERIAMFRETCGDYTIETQLVSHDADKVVMKALIYAPPAFNGNETGFPENDAWQPGKLLATGYAEENRDASTINKTSALENCETSAVGRALAFFGLAGTEIASADEVAQAIKQQGAQELVEYNNLVREFFYEIAEVKSMLEPKWGESENQPNVTHARALLKELGDDTYQKLWKAPSRGGIFSTHERAILKQPPENSL